MRRDKFALPIGLALAIGGCSSSNGAGGRDAAGSSQDSGSPDVTLDAPAADAGDATTIDAGSALAFVGTWACTFTVSDAFSDGASNSGSVTVAISACTSCASSEIDESVLTPDGGFVCSISSSTSGNTAALLPNQSCSVGNGQTFTYQSGTATVSGDTLTFSGTGVDGQSVSETCTRQSTDSGLTTEADGSADATLDGSAVDASDAGCAPLVCAQPPNPAPLINLACGITPPTPAGGTLVDGTYYATSATSSSDDGGCSTEQTHATAVICGGTMTFTLETPATPTNGNGWFVADYTPTTGTTLDGACLCGDVAGCPDSGGGSSGGGLPYTATGTTLTFFIGDGVVTLTKQ